MPAWLIPILEWIVAKILPILIKDAESAISQASVDSQAKANKDADLAKFAKQYQDAKTQQEQEDALKALISRSHNP